MPRDRMLFVDNIRFVLCALVVCHHAFMTYWAMGGWYYRDPVVAGPAARYVFLLFISFNQSFFMGTFFALAGYFAAMALGKKGGASFVTGRFVRLGLPTFFYMAVLNPLTAVLGHSAAIRAKGGVGVYYRQYLTSLDILSGSGPMWFTLALLVFCLVYAGLGAVRGPVATRGAPRPVTAGLLAGLVLACAAGTFCVRLVFPVGKLVYNMQLGNFVQYILLFAFGVVAYANDWLRSLDARLGRRCLWMAFGALAAWAAMLPWLGPAHMRNFTGGPNGPSLIFACWE